MSQASLIELLEDRRLLSAAAFAPPVRYATGVSAHSIAYGDFRHSGFQDIAVANPDDNSVSIFFNQGDGSFVAQPKIRLPHPAQIVSGDFNGDGTVDLAVLTSAIPVHAVNLAGNRSTSDALVLLIGNGAGGFTQGQAFRVIGGNHHLITADFNRDGRPDLAITTFQGVGIVLNTGNGSFAPEVAYTTANSSVASQLITGDFNGDGAPDLAVALGERNAVRILLNNGTGAFTVEKAYKVPGNPVQLATADFNHDGHVDVAAVGNGYRQGLRVLLGNGDGTFQLGPISASGAFLQSVTMADFNGDGQADLAVVDFTSSVRVSSGLGNGLFSSFAILPGGPQAFLVSTADLNNDGKPDLVVLRHDQIFVYLNTTP